MKFSFTCKNKTNFHTNGTVARQIIYPWSCSSFSLEGIWSRCEANRPIQCMSNIRWKQSWVAGRTDSFCQQGTESDLWLRFHVTSFCVCITISCPIQAEWKDWQLRDNCDS